jgi:hypothetical protein
VCTVTCSTQFNTVQHSSHCKYYSFKYLLNIFNTVFEVFIKQISLLNILNKLYISVLSLENTLSHNTTLFGFCTVQNLNTGCAKILKKLPASNG